MVEQKIVLNFFIKYKKNKPSNYIDNVLDLILKFQNEFPVDKIEKLDVKDYSLGYGDETFCKWLEYKTQECGKTKGKSYANKYYIYSNKELSKNNKFMIREGRETNEISYDEAKKKFSILKKELLKLYNCGLNDNFENIDKYILLRPIARTKFVYMYFPNKLLPIMSSEHLEKICDKLNFNYDKNKPVFTNYLLLKKLRENPLFKNEHTNFIGSFFYETFDLKDSNTKKINFEKNRKYKEGKIIEFKYHSSKERNYKLIKDAKIKFKQENNGKLFCECCGFDFLKIYGYQYIEAHHIIPISKLTKETKMTLKDIKMLCSNCHSMIHYYFKDKNLEIIELQEIIRKNDLINNL